MATALRELTNYLTTFAPLDLAESWDNVGLLLGDENAPVERIMTCLTLTPDVADEALEQNATLIVSHHPILFRPVQRLTSSTSEGRMLLALLREGIAVYSPHTAFDSARLGINQQLAEQLGLTDIVPLRPAEQPHLSELGTGRCGRLAEPVPLRQFLKLIKERLPTPRTLPSSSSSFPLPFVGDPEQLIQTVGIGCGSAGEFLKDATAAGCDVFLTGETRFHTCLEARDCGTALVLAGHYQTERPAVEQLATLLKQTFPELEVWASHRESDPVLWSLE